MAFNDGPPFGPVVNGTMVVVFWEYRPSNVAAYIFLALFVLATFGHFVYLARLRAWNFIPFILGGICQIFGYLERADAHSDPTHVRPWILQNMLLLVSPPLLAASLYLALHQATDALLHGTNHNTGPKRSCCRTCCIPTTTKAYILADVAAIFTQLIGTVMPASGTEEGRRIGKTVVLIGLAVQLAALGSFVGISCGMVHARLRRDPSRSRAMMADPGVNWLGYFVVMEVAAVMLIVRSVVRGAEFLEGAGGVVMGHEVFIYVFDGLAMLVVMVGFLVLHPARLVREVVRLEEREKMVEGRGSLLS
ncbi:RTA1 like protein-domain-containing protein [Chaetomium sp. MPI-CAGE-AT-0009]|nr:RTA1 like protein-domain-containing protein [Chaetomium sp. MPI-CAGE-AT-0009]